MPKSRFMKLKNTPQFKSRVRNLCAVVATAIALPALAYADNDKKSDRGNDGKGDNGKRGNHPIPVVPEANAAWVLVPFLGAVLLFSSRNLFRAKVTE
jgi:hypothetical protein